MGKLDDIIAQYEKDDVEKQKIQNVKSSNNNIAMQSTQPPQLKQQPAYLAPQQLQYNSQQQQQQQYQQQQQQNQFQQLTQEQIDQLTPQEKADYYYKYQYYQSYYQQQYYQQYYQQQQQYQGDPQLQQQYQRQQQIQQQKAQQQIQQQQQVYQQQQAHQTQLQKQQEQQRIQKEQYEKRRKEEEDKRKEVELRQKELERIREEQLQAQILKQTPNSGGNSSSILPPNLKSGDASYFSNSKKQQSKGFDDTRWSKQIVLTKQLYDKFELPYPDGVECIDDIPRKKVHTENNSELTPCQIRQNEIKQQIQQLHIYNQNSQVWPQNLQFFIKQSFEKCKTVKDQQEMSKEMTQVIKEADQKQELYTREWEKVPILLTLREKQQQFGYMPPPPPPQFLMQNGNNGNMHNGINFLNPPDFKQQQLIFEQQERLKKEQQELQNKQQHQQMHHLNGNNNGEQNGLKRANPYNLNNKVVLPSNIKENGQKNESSGGGLRVGGSIESIYSQNQKHKKSNNQIHQLKQNELKQQQSSQSQHKDSPIKKIKKIDLKQNTKYQSEKSSSQQMKYIEYEFEDFQKMAETKKIIGINQELEKKYVRAKDIPDCSEIRPEHILKKSLKLILEKWKNQKVDYNYMQDQFRSIRQDLVVQRIQNEFAVKVCEHNARICIEGRDIQQFSECCTTLFGYYHLGVSGNKEEFTCYKLITHHLSGETTHMAKYMSFLKKDDMDVTHPLIQFFFDLYDCTTTGNFYRFFQLYREAPYMTQQMIDLKLDKMRIWALTQICKGFGQTIDVKDLQDLMNFYDEDHLDNFLSQLKIKKEDGKINLKNALKQIQTQQ